MKTNEERLVQLETIFSHLQRTLQVLDEVVIEQGRKLDSLQREIRIVTQDLRTLRESGRETRRAEDEIPPHY